MAPKQNNNSADTASMEKSGVSGLIILVLIVVLIMLLGGLFAWHNTYMGKPTPLPVAERPSASENNEPESTKAEADVQILDTVSTSDSLDAIQADIESTNLDGLDAEINAIEAELENALE